MPFDRHRRTVIISDGVFSENFIEHVYKRIVYVLCIKKVIIFICLRRNYSK